MTQLHETCDIEVFVPKFDLNTNDIRSVVDFMKEICDKFLRDDDQFSQGSKHLLKAIIKILKRLSSVVEI